MKNYARINRLTFKVDNIIIAEDGYFEGSVDYDLWIECNNGEVGKYAGIGYTYDQQLAVFIPPKPYNSWELDTSDYTWNSPIEYPNRSENYIWDEETTSWIEPD